MTEYHINPTSGRANKCADSATCPHSGHWTSREAAQRAAAMRKTVASPAPQGKPARKTSKLAEAEAKFEACLDSRGSLHGGLMAQLSQEEWLAVAGELEGDFLKRAASFREECRLLEELEEEYQVAKLRRGLQEADRHSVEEFEFKEDLEAAKRKFAGDEEANKKLRELRDSAEVLYRYYSRVARALVASELVAPGREVFGRALPPGYSAFSALYDSEGEVYSYLPDGRRVRAMVEIYPSFGDAAVRAEDSTGKKLVVHATDNQTVLSGESIGEYANYQLSLGVVAAPAAAAVDLSESRHFVPATFRRLQAVGGEDAPPSGVQSKLGELRRRLPGQVVASLGLEDYLEHNAQPRRLTPATTTWSAWTAARKGLPVVVLAVKSVTRFREVALPTAMRDLTREPHPQW